MANEFVARKGIISLGEVTVDTLSGNNGEIITLDANGKLVASGTTTSAIGGTVTSITVGTGLDIANGTTTPNITLDLSEFTDMTADVVGTADELILLDNGAERKKMINEIKLGQFNNDQGWTANVGDITGVTVTAGAGLSGGGAASSGAFNKTVSIDYAGTDNFILSATDGTSLGNIEGSDKIAFVDLDNAVKYAEVDQLPFNNFTYTHPTHAGDDINIDTTALTGATVISDLDFNITTDTSGHVTDANGTVSTRELTLGDLGYTGTTDANTYVHPNHTGDVTSVADGATTLAAAAITGKTALTTGLASTDELLVSDAGTLKKMDVSVIETYMQNNLTFTTNTDVNVNVTNLVDRLDDITGDASIGGGSSVITIPGDLVVTGTTTTNNVETVSTSNGVVFEGSAADANELTLLAGTLTADRTVTLPNATGTVALTSNIGNATITIGSGTGLTGGTSFTANQSANETITLNVVGGTGITANANDVAIDYAGTNNFIDSATNLEGTAIATADTIVYHDATDNNVKKGLVSDLPFTDNVGDITGVTVTAGTGLTGGGSATSGNYSKTLNVIGGDGITANANDIEVDSTVVRTTGTQTIGGSKAFTSELSLKVDGDNSIAVLTTSYEGNVADGGTTTLASYTTATETAVFFDYKIYNGTTDLRAGTVMAITNGSTVAYTEYSTGDIGDTSGVTMAADYASGAVRLRATNNAGATYRANVFVRTF